MYTALKLNEKISGPGTRLQGRKNNDFVSHKPSYHFVYVCALIVRDIQHKKRIYHPIQRNHLKL